MTKRERTWMRRRRSLAAFAMVTVRTPFGEVGADAVICDLAGKQDVGAQSFHSSGPAAQDPGARLVLTPRRVSARSARNTWLSRLLVREADLHCVRLIAFVHPGPHSGVEVRDEAPPSAALIIEPAHLGESIRAQGSSRCSTRTLRTASSRQWPRYGRLVLV